MAELEEMTILLEDLDKKEKELTELSGKLNKKDLVSRVSQLQTLIIKYQREAITTLLRIQRERDYINKGWVELVEAVSIGKDALKEAEGAVKSSWERRISDLMGQIASKDKAIGSLNEEINLLKLRIKALTSGT